MHPVRAQLTLAVVCCGAPARPLGITSVFDRELPNMAKTFMSILCSKMVLKTSVFFSLSLIKCPNARHETNHFEKYFETLFLQELNWILKIKDWLDVFVH